jgi:predicted amidophosphoribosyltransferase
LPRSLCRTGAALLPLRLAGRRDGLHLRRVPDDAAAFDATLAAVDYRSPWDRLVPRSFHGALDLAAVFADVIVGANEDDSGRGLALVLPVPLAGRLSAATTRPGSWRAGSRAARPLRAEPDLPRLAPRPAHQLALPSPSAPVTRGAFAVAAPPRRAGGPPRAIVDDVMTT